MLLGVLGVLGVLGLTRVLALVNLAAFLTVLLIAQVPRRRRPGSWLPNAGIAAVLAAAVAAPWWVTAGPTPLHYLLSAGYDASSGFAPKASLPQRFSDRFVVTVGQTGLLVGLLLLAGAVAAVLLALRAPGGAWRGTRPAFVGGVALLPMAGLGTCSNAGTAFALPAVVLAAAATCAVVPAVPAVRRAALGAGAAVLVAAVLGQDGVLPRVAVAGRPLGVALASPESPARTAGMASTTSVLPWRRRSWRLGRPTSTTVTLCSVRCLASAAP